MTLDAFIRALPKTETHLHIEGALPYAMLREWRPEVYPAEPAFHAPDHRFASFGDFDRVLLAHALPWFDSPARYHEAARWIFAAHLAQGVHYVECSFHLPVGHFIGAPTREIVDAILSAVPPGLVVKLYAGMLRSDYGGPVRARIDELERLDAVAGVDLHGDEAAPTEPWTAGVWSRLRAAGKTTKCHAGEFGGAERVREAIEALGVRRVQHGVRAIEDPEVVALAAERGVVFDVAPISNVRLGVVPDLASHPLRALVAAGVACTVSTDDPLIFNTTLCGEYRALADEAGFTRAELAQLAAAGWRVADVSASRRDAALIEIDRLLAAD